MYRILMIDDDTEVLELNKRYFENKECIVQICDHAEKAMELLNRFRPDCILLDVMMPGFDGFALCKKMRHITGVPILFLSGKVSEDDKIKGFSCGADDYIEKPYSVKEVYVRIVANIRRHHEAAAIRDTSEWLEVSPLSFELKSHKVWFSDCEIPMTGTDYDILLFLAQRVNIEITYEELGIAVWGVYQETDRRSVMVYVSRLRKKLKEYTGMDNIVETVWSKGYKMVEH